MTTRRPEFTIIGASGFIGSHLSRYLRELGHVCHAPARNDAALFERPLANVIYCAGLTADSRSRPHDTVEAHVSLLNRMLQHCRFDSLLYLSSTRVYIRSRSTEEAMPIEVAPLEPEDLFNLSKLMGESICLQSGRPNVRVARLSNVLGADFGSHNFVFSLIREALGTGGIELHTTLDSEKDYIHVQDVVELLPRVALEGKHRSYNIASGVNHSNSQILEKITAELPVNVTISPGARQIRFKSIDTNRIRGEFGFSPRPILPLVSELARTFPRPSKAGNHHG